jgi:hypothetical protein
MGVIGNTVDPRLFQLSPAAQLVAGLLPSRRKLGRGTHTNEADEGAPKVHKLPLCQSLGLQEILMTSSRGKVVCCRVQCTLYPVQTPYADPE